MNLLADLGSELIGEFLRGVGLRLEVISLDEKIPGSFWGEPEAGLIKNALYARHDTPIHSILHEAGHYICMTPERRAALHTNALGNTKGDFTEENAVCYLQILMADEINGFSQKEIFKDMDEWGYSFRLGSTQKWFESDASDAREWLVVHRLIDENDRYLFVLRESIKRAGND